MNVAETAELAVYLKLYADAYNRGLKGAEASTAHFGRTATAIGGHLKSGLGSALTNVTHLALIGGAALGAGLASQVKFGIDALQDLEKVTAATTQVLKSTRDASGQTTKGVVDLANAMEDLNATIDNKVIQSTENLLLTFTSIGPKAFKPALQAVLDMNQALGGGEGGLQSVAIQVGKALQDPIRGITALRRVGVNFSEDQIKTIKNLIKHNNLLGAQKLILAELSKEFGGQFATAGKTAEGTFAKLGDTIEDLQMNLALALLPAITDVVKELNSFLSDTSVQRGVADFGKGLAGAFRNAVTFAKQVPWKAIGDGLKTAAEFAGELVKRFAEAPDWLKTAVITGWGLNKLTGGALTGIVGDIAKGVGGQFVGRGANPAMPLFVKEVGVGGAAGTAAAGGAASAAATAAALIGFDIALQSIAHNPVMGQTVANAFGVKTPGQTNFGPTAGGSDLQRIIAAQRAANGTLGGREPFPMFGPPITMFGPPTPGGSHSEDRRIAMASIDAIRANTTALRLNARDIEKAWLATIDEDKIGGRSKSKFGRDATKEQIAATRTRDELHQLKVITEKSKASSDSKLERLRVLAADAKAHGDTKTATKIQTAISRMKSEIKAAADKTTSAVTVSGDKVATAIAQSAGSRSDLNVYVTTNVTANSVTRATTSVARYGNTGGDRRYDP